MQTANTSLVNKAEAINRNVLKRAFDIYFSVLLFITVFIWLFPLLAIFIKLNSRGKVFFIQNRIGINGSIFSCYKFRTLPQKAVAEEDKFLTGDNIPATSVGKWLRRLNIDELPQFINVLKGEMSIVGPRPHAIAYHNKYAGYIPNINDRLLIKPGITGLAQIKGYRGDVADEELNKVRTNKRIAFDILYIEHWSFITDLKIVLITFLQMIGVG